MPQQGLSSESVARLKAIILLEMLAAGFDRSDLAAVLRVSVRTTHRYEADFVANEAKYMHCLRSHFWPMDGREDEWDLTGWRLRNARRQRRRLYNSSDFD